MRSFNLKNIAILPFLIALILILIQRESIFVAVGLLSIAYPYFYVPIMIGIAYFYFVKKLDLSGTKQHLIGGGIAGLSFPIFIFLVTVPLSNIVDTAVDRFSPYPASPTQVYSINSSVQENLILYLTFGLISIVVGAISAFGFFELWPIIRMFFKEKFGLGSN